MPDDSASDPSAAPGSIMLRDDAGVVHTVHFTGAVPSMSDLSAILGQLPKSRAACFVRHVQPCDDHPMPAIWFPSDGKSYPVPNMPGMFQSLTIDGADNSESGDGASLLGPLAGIHPSHSVGPASTNIGQHVDAGCGQHVLRLPWR